MKTFLQHFGSLVSGVLHGFDQLRSRGSKRLLCNPGGVFSFLSQVRVPLKDYTSYARDTTVELCKAIGRPAAGLYHSLNNSQESKRRRCGGPSTGESEAWWRCSAASSRAESSRSGVTGTKSWRSGSSPANVFYTITTWMRTTACAIRGSRAGSPSRCMWGSTAGTGWPGR